MREMTYTIYGGELSLFTRKLESACIFHGLDFQIAAKTRNNRAEIESRSGTHQVPVLQTPENWMIADTTPLIALLDSRSPNLALFPSGAAGTLVHILEEFFDEWVARVMVHYRWHYPASAKFASQRMASGDAAMAAQLRDWGPRACRATGTQSVGQQQAAEAEYLGLMQAADQQLRSTRFLLGDRPTALDCIVLGGLRAHTLMDPDPKKVVGQFETLADWSAQRAHRWTGGGELAPLPESTPFAQFVLTQMHATYARFALANAAAQRAGAKACSADVYGESASYLSRAYPEQSRLMLCQRIDQLQGSQRELITNLLKKHQLDDCFINSP
jgi:glutathione S-transferase